MARKRRERPGRSVSRRTFLQGSATLVAGCSDAGAPSSTAPPTQEGGTGTSTGGAGSGTGGALGATGGRSSDAGADVTAPGTGGSGGSGGAPVSPTKLPMRMFGRDSKVPVSILGLGGWPLGQSSISGDLAQQLWNRAIDEGINYLDSAQNYNQSHARMRELLQTRRSEVVVVTKISSTVTLQAIENILTGLGIEYLDGLHLHNYGGRTWGDALSVMRQAKERGLIRNIGLSGHENAQAFIPAIETGDIDLVMNPQNFVDRNAYTFETTVRETAKRFGTNVVAMKVWGGPSNWQGQRTLVDASFSDHIDDALRYSLGLEDVVSAVIGIKNEEELLQAIEVARNFTPLAPDRLQSLLATGQTLSGPRGRFYGN